ncbi:hypothetical protein BJ875DRAFT_501522 [Amylocarpus encephaloides]|uniref:Uncharacterized protein n=1 Tax=Amylocarpus encephaloides TaxID=45428 RepID=A0A9P7YT77_9HELO|nr:hypothetical protein BJ875DRAFT_501522 [Amylocarpus encephaloides]
MYFFNAVDRSNLGNVNTDGLDVDLNFKGNEYSLLILLLLYTREEDICNTDALCIVMVGRGCLALVQCAANNFVGLLVIRLLLGVCEAGLFAGVLGFRLAIFFGSALLASAFSGLISYGVFHISRPQVRGWMWLFIIEDGLTVIVGFLNNEEKAAARARSLRYSSKTVGSEFILRQAFGTWRGWRFGVLTFHIVFALCLSLLGMIVLAAVDVLVNKGVAYFASFMMAAGAYTPSVLVHSWHNNNNLEEKSRAATTGLLVGLGNPAGILSAATFRVEYAPAYIPTLIATQRMKCFIRAEDVNTESLANWEKSLQWRFFT